jgi:type III secretory pathway component EscU
MSAVMMSASALYEFGDMMYKVSLWNVIFWFWMFRFLATASYLHLTRLILCPGVPR